MRERHFYQSIRFKLFLVSLTLLAIPWAGYRYIEETETFLRQAQEQTLLGTAQAVATILHNREQMFSNSNGASDLDSTLSQIYVQPLRQPIQVDGYIEEWLPYVQNAQRHPEHGPLHYQSLVAEYQGYIYLNIQVTDDRIIYQRDGDPNTDKSDRLELMIEQPNGNLSHYQLTTSSPGWISATRINARGLFNQRRETRIQGEWQESKSGYTIELRIPRYLVGERIAFGVADVDDHNTRATSRFTTSTGEKDLVRPGLMVKPNPEIARIISGLEHRDARIWVLNREKQVLAVRGSLKSPEKNPDQASPDEIHPLLHLLFRLVLDQPSNSFEDIYQNSTRLKGDELEAALRGNAMAHRRTTPDGLAVILSAAWPINSREGVLGAVLVEQSTNQILSLQNRVLERLFSISLILFLITSTALLGFASLLVSRIRKLRNQVEVAVSAEGQIKGELAKPNSTDEIGDLGRSFSGVLDRLAEYNRYLENMASRLAHELRTPLSVVQSSLENLEANPPLEDQQRYLRHAKEGTQRLALTLHRMREATRLEQTLQDAQQERFDLSNLLQISLESYQSAFPESEFELNMPTEPVYFEGTPDLISQALDKLVSNAIDFHQPDTPIKLALAQRERAVQLSVSNQGPSLPPEMESRLFDSMVSIRDRKGVEPHLGLGLYLVRLIAEFHRGTAVGTNNENNSGVTIMLKLPAP